MIFSRLYKLHVAQKSLYRSFRIANIETALKRRIKNKEKNNSRGKKKCVCEPHTHTHTTIGYLIIPAQEIHFSLALRIKQELCINRCVVIICAPLHLGNRKMRFQSPLHLQHLPMLNEKKRQMSIHEKQNRTTSSRCHCPSSR